MQKKNKNEENGKKIAKERKKEKKKICCTHALAHVTLSSQSYVLPHWCYDLFPQLETRCL